MSSLFRKTGRAVQDMDTSQPLQPQFIEADKAWGEPPVWDTIKEFSGR
jgi:hypothetical protein